MKPTVEGGLWVAAALVVGSLVGLVVGVSPLAAVILAVLVAGALLLSRPAFWVAAVGVALPMTPVLVIEAGVAVVPIVDILALVGILSFALNGGRVFVSTSRAVLAGLVLVVPYLALGYLVTRSHVEAGVEGWITYVQRVELLLLWLFFGALIYLRGHLDRFLRGFLIGATVVAAAWYVHPGADSAFGMQKNASGGYLACAVIILVLLQVKGWRLVLQGGFIVGALVLTGSRGSLLGMVAGVAIAGLFVTNWKRVLGLAAVAAGAAGLALALLPQVAVDRILSRSQSGRLNIEIRDVFRRDALEQWHAHPDGLGVGGYHQFLPELQAVQTFDPHNAWILALVEGGAPLLAAFLFFTAGSLVLALRTTRVERLVGQLALCVQASIFTHVYFDVYWVRGTPVPGILLTGACAAALYSAAHAKSAGPSAELVVPEGELDGVELEGLGRRVGGKAR